MSKVNRHFNKIAKRYDFFKSKNSFYYSNLKDLLTSLIPKGKKVLEFGCGTGDLIAYLHPNPGVGYDPSVEMIKIARNKHSNIKFTTKIFNDKFDYIFMSDVVEHLKDPEKEFKKISKLMHKDTLFINTMANPIWEPLLMLWEKLGLKMPEGPHHRFKIYDLRIMIKKTGMRIIKHDYKLLVPVYIPIITNLFNKYLEKYFKKYAFIEYFVAKKT